MSDYNYDLELWRAAWRYSSNRAEALARKAVHAMQRFPASGIFGDREHRTLWDEFCHECQYGPHELLELAWAHTIEGYVSNAADTVDPLERDMMQYALAEPGQRPIALEEAVKSALREIAGRRDLSRFEA